MIKLRELKESDAVYMLEWMHDPDINQWFKFNMRTLELKDAVEFCKNAMLPETVKDGSNLHFAISNEKDEYLGTISLKNVDIENKSAEYAIALRKKYQKRGWARIATGKILEKAFKQYGLHKIYLNVLSTNYVATRFYEKCGFSFEGEFREHLIINGKYVNWKWYSILNYEYNCELYK